MSKDDTAVKDEVATQDATVDAPAVPETKEPVAEEKDIMEASLEDLSADDDEPETDSQDEPKADDTAGKDEAEETKETPQTGDKPLAPKSENRFQKLANENKDLRERLAQVKTQETQLATEQELLEQVNPDTGEYYTPLEAERIARQQANESTQQTLAQERYNLEVQQNQTIIHDEATLALQDFPMFDEQSKDYNKSLAEQADKLLKQALIFDDNGTLVGSQLSPYELYKTIAESSQANAPQLLAEAQKNTEKMLANADQMGGSSQATKTKVDPMLEAFKEEAGLR